MKARIIGSLLLAVVIAQSPLWAQEKGRPARSIAIHTPNGWMLDIYTDGSGLLQFGSSAGDGWRFKAGTFNVKQATQDLLALACDDKGGSGSHFAYSFESERQAPDKPDKARYTRDAKTIPGLLKTAADSAESRGEFHARRKAEILKKKPLGELPKEK